MTVQAHSDIVQAHSDIVFWFTVTAIQTYDRFFGRGRSTLCPLTQILWDCGLLYHPCTLHIMGLGLSNHSNGQVYDIERRLFQVP